MADYYPLLARALDGLPDSTPAARRTVYDRAQAALLTQLRSLQPPLSAAEIERERASLDEAIDRAEEAYGRPPEAEPVRPEPARSRAERADPTPAIRGGQRRGRALALGLGLPVVVGSIAVAAWFWRDDPAAPVRTTAPVQAPARPAGGEAKIADRVAGGPSSERVAEAPVRPPPAPTPPVPPAAAPPPPVAAPAPAPRPSEPATAGSADLAVAQRALMVEENAADPQNPKLSTGRALWRIDATNAGQGQPLETVVRATVEVPEEGLTLQLAMRRNLDATLPASHTIELTFAPSASGRAVRDVGLPQIRTDEAARGAALAGLSVPVKENVFLIGLSDLRSDVERNAGLLQRGAWIDLQMRFASGARANLSFEKGISGERVVAEAFRQWDGPR